MALQTAEVDDSKNVANRYTRSGRSACMGVTGSFVPTARQA
jgi:hypothetical protein